MNDSNAATSMRQLTIDKPDTHIDVGRSIVRRIERLCEGVGVKKTPARDLRPSVKPPTAKASCYVCDISSSICQWHHLVSLGDLSKMRVTAYSVMYHGVRYISLCPNHHVILHRVLRAANMQTLFDADQSGAEASAIFELVSEMVEQIKWWADEQTALLEDREGAQWC